MDNKLKLVIRYLGVVMCRKELDPGEYTIGRGPDVDILLTHDFISRKYGKVYFQDGAWFYQDLREKHPRYRKEPWKFSDTQMLELENDIDILTEGYLFFQDTGVYDIRDLKSMASTGRKGLRRARWITLFLILALLGGGGAVVYYYLTRPMDVNTLMKFVRPKVVELELPISEKARQHYKKYGGYQDKDFLEASSFCTGFIIAPDVVLTCSHCLHHRMFIDVNPNFVVKTHDGKTHKPEKVLGFNAKKDFLFLEVPGIAGYGALEFRDDVEVGEKVYTVGNALGQGIAIRDGIMASTTQDRDDPDVEYIRYSAAASPGNSGGPLVDGHGRVLGLVFAGNWAETYNLGTPAAYLTEGKRAFVDDRSSKAVALHAHHMLNYNPRMFLVGLMVPGPTWSDDDPEFYRPFEKVTATVTVPEKIERYAELLIQGLADSVSKLALQEPLGNQKVNPYVRSWEGLLSDKIKAVPLASSGTRKFRFENDMLLPLAIEFRRPPAAKAYKKWYSSRTESQYKPVFLSWLIDSTRIWLQIKRSEDDKKEGRFWFHSAPRGKVNIQALGWYGIHQGIFWYPQDQKVPDYASVRKPDSKLLLGGLVGEKGALASSRRSYHLRPAVRREFTIKELSEEPTHTEWIKDETGREWKVIEYSMFEDTTILTFCLPQPLGLLCLTTSMQTPTRKLLEVLKGSFLKYDLSKYILVPEFTPTAALEDFCKQELVKQHPPLSDFELIGGDQTYRIRLKTAGLDVMLPKVDGKLPSMLKLNGWMISHKSQPRWVATGIDSYYPNGKQVCSAGISVDEDVVPGLIEALRKLTKDLPKRLGISFRTVEQDVKISKLSGKVKSYAYCLPLEETEDDGKKYKMVDLSAFSMKPYAAKFVPAGK